MWQRNFPSPHLSYFNPSVLRQMMEVAGFTLVHEQALRSVDHSGLWRRLRYGGSSVPASAAAWLCLTLLVPILRLLPADISLQIFRLDRC